MKKNKKINDVLDFLSALSLLGFLYYIFNYKIIFNSNISDTHKYELYVLLILAIINTGRIIINFNNKK